MDFTNFQNATPVAPSSSGGSQSLEKPAEKPQIISAYPRLAELPTQAGPMGIRFDFNQGARLLLPVREEAQPPWECRIRDLDTGNILFECANRGAYVASSKIYYVKFRLEVSLESKIVFEHDYDCSGKDVLIQFPLGTLGDTLAWFPYSERFRQAHGCKLTCALSPAVIPLLKDAYPEINFVTHEEVEESKLYDTFYGTYSMGLFFDDHECRWQPLDFRYAGLHCTAGNILGVDSSETRARIVVDEGGPPIADPYVCIAVQASSGCKMWHNPEGWREVVAHIRRQGYRVICIDQRPFHGSNLVYTHIPHGCEDETGSRPLTERARWLKHAAAFVGLSSGLSWLAWSAGVPVVMISGFTWPANEFETPYRVINWHTCNGCWNDPKERFSHTDFMWCPRHKGTDRHFECTRLITPHQVIAQVDRALEMRAAGDSVVTGKIGTVVRKKAARRSAG